jgi:GT2 family glycosyltransferase
MRISWVLLTYNRSKTVAQAMAHNVATSGRKWDELIWCDNNSTDDVRDVVRAYSPDVEILNKTNLGVAKGYNRAMALASGTHIVITGCDVLMPDNWLSKFEEGFREIANLAVLSMYSERIEKVPERIRGDVETFGNLLVRPAMPIGRRMFKRELLKQAGYFHEGFGLYGWEDVAWGHTVERYCKGAALKCYNVEDKICQHLGTEGNVGYDYKDEHEYWAWKKDQVNDPAKRQLMEKLSSDNWPAFFPY